MFNTWNPQEIETFLARHSVGAMGTIDDNGYPHVLPMWHTVFDGQIYISFRVPKKKHENLVRNPKMSYTVDAGDDFATYHGVMIQGDAEFVDDPELLERYYVAWAYRHFGSDRDPYYRKVTAGKRSVIRLDPVHVFTWDHRTKA